MRKGAGQTVFQICVSFIQLPFIECLIHRRDHSLIKTKTFSHYKITAEILTIHKNIKKIVAIR